MKSSVISTLHVKIRGLLVLTFLILFVPFAAAQVTVTPDSTAKLSFAAASGSNSTSIGLNLNIANDTSVMGFKFDIQFPTDTFRYDSTTTVADSFLTAGASGNETYVFIIDRSSETGSPTGTVTVIGVRMQSLAASKGVKNALVTLLSSLRFQKKNADSTFQGRDTIFVTNFVFRDVNNDTVNSSKVQIQLGLFLLLLRRGSDFNGDGSQDGIDLIDLLRVLRGYVPLGAYLDYGSPGDAALLYENRSSDSAMTGEDLIIFLRYLRGIEI